MRPVLKDAGANHANNSRPKLREDGFSTLIVDNHFVTRLGIKQLLIEEFRGISFGEAATKPEALEAIQRRSWHAVTLEINIPGNRGLQLLQEILHLQPAARILVLSVHPAGHYARKALSLGAFAYLTKDCPRLDLVKAFTHTLTGKRPPGSSLNSSLNSPSDANSSVIPAVESLHEILSSREYKVWLALAAGKRPGEIAAELRLSPKTISTYKRRILKKLRMNTSADLVRYAIERQLI